MTRSVQHATTTHARLPALMLVVVSFCLAASVALSARAQTWTAVAAGSNQGFRGSGLDLQFKTDWVEGPGYIPIHVTARQIGPARSERRITIELKHSVSGDRSTIVRQEIDVPLPPKSTTVRVPVPKWVTDYSAQYELNVYDGGRRLRSFSGNSVSLRGASGVSAFNETVPRVLFIADTMRDSSTLGMMFPELYTNNATGAGIPLTSSKTIPPTDLLTEWIDFSCFDLIVISREQLDTLAEDQSDAWPAIRRWVLAGGNLLVHGYPDDWSGIEAIDQIVSAPLPADLSAAEDVDGWHWTTDRELLRPLDNEVVDDPYDLRMWAMDPSVANTPGFGPANTPGFVPFRQSPATPRKNAKLSPADAKRQSIEDAMLPHVRWRRAGLGTVVAVAEEDLFPGKRAIWRVIFNTLDPPEKSGKAKDDRWHWHQRYGVSMLQENPTFWDFLVPGVGHALVGEFQVLITLFVVLIGPLNYFLLRRRHKLHLIVFTTPASAAVLTIALMSWGLVADGLSTRARARTYTYIDQRDGTAVCWSRLSYYAGIAPAGGLVFPRDVAVIPLRVFNTESSSIVWTTHWDDAQRLESGWLPSRTPTQLLTVRSRKTAAGLGIVTHGDTNESDVGTSNESDVGTSNEDASIVVTNSLGTGIKHLLISDAKGRLFAISDALAPGKVVTLTQLDTDAAQTAAAAMRAGLAEHPLQRPEGFTADSTTLYGRRSRWMSYGQAGDSVRYESSRLERGYGEVARWIGPAAPKLPPRTYVAVVERSPEVVFGTDQAHEEASTHLIVGVW